MTCSNCYATETLGLSWRRPHRVRKALKYYVVQVVNLGNRRWDDVHIFRRKSFSNSKINKVATISHAFQSKTGVALFRLLSLKYCLDDQHVRMGWKVLDNGVHMNEPIDSVDELVPLLFGKLLRRKSKPADLFRRVSIQPGP